VGRATGANVASAILDEHLTQEEAIMSASVGFREATGPKCVEDIDRATDRQLTDAVNTIVAKIEPGEDLPPDKAREWRDDLIAAERA
jgi:hypothetical protein